VQRGFVSVTTFCRLSSVVLSSTGQARRGQGELSRAASGQAEVEADGGRERTVHIPPRSDKVACDQWHDHRKCWWCRSSFISVFGPPWPCRYVLDAQLAPSVPSSSPLSLSVQTVERIPISDEDRNE